MSNAGSAKQQESKSMSVSPSKVTQTCSDLKSPCVSADASAGRRWCNSSARLRISSMA